MGQRINNNGGEKLKDVFKGKEALSEVVEKKLFGGYNF